MDNQLELLEAKKRREEMVKAVLSGLGMSRSEFILTHSSDIERLATQAIILADEIIEQLDNVEEGEEE